MGRDCCSIFIEVDEINSLTSFFQVFNFDQVESTSNEAIRLAKQGRPEGLLVNANSQSKGRGRLGKKWVSQIGNLYCSLILRPEIQISKATELSFVSSLALREVVLSLIEEQKEVVLKWPNDILVSNKKIGGILLESQTKKNSNYVEWIVVGFGLNLISIPKNIKNVTCIAHENIQLHNVNKSNIIKLLSLNFEKFYSSWKINGFKKIINEWKEYTFPIGTTIQFDLNGSKVIGKFVRLFDDGSLSVHINGTGNKIITSGEVNIVSTIK